MPNENRIEECLKLYQKLKGKEGGIRFGWINDIYEVGYKYRNLKLGRKGANILICDIVKFYKDLCQCDVDNFSYIYVKIGTNKDREKRHQENIIEAERWRREENDDVEETDMNIWEANGFEDEADALKNWDHDFSQGDDCFIILIY